MRGLCLDLCFLQPLTSLYPHMLLAREWCPGSPLIFSLHGWIVTKLKDRLFIFFNYKVVVLFIFLLIFINTHLTFSGECFHLEHHRWTRTNMVFIFSPQFSELSIYTHIHTHTISNWQLKVQTGTEKLSRKSKTNVPGGGVQGRYPPLKKTWNIPASVPFVLLQTFTTWCNACSSELQLKCNTCVALEYFLRLTFFCQNIWHKMVIFHFRRWGNIKKKRNVKYKTK